MTAVGLTGETFLAIAVIVWLCSGGTGPSKQEIAREVERRLKDK